MPTEKIIDPNKKWGQYKPCLSQEHNVPSHQVFEPGEYVHTCPDCGNKIYFHVNGYFMTNRGVTGV